MRWMRVLQPKKVSEQVPVCWDHFGLASERRAHHGCSGCGLPALHSRVTRAQADPERVALHVMLASSRLDERKTRPRFIADLHDKRRIERRATLHLPHLKLEEPRWGREYKGSLEDLPTCLNLTLPHPPPFQTQTQDTHTPPDGCSPDATVMLARSCHERQTEPRRGLKRQMFTRSIQNTVPYHAAASTHF